MRRYFYMLSLLYCCISIIAAPATPDTLHYTQPDGSTIDLLLHGDEHFHYLTDTHGQWVAEAQDGFYYSTTPLTTTEIDEHIKRSPILKARSSNRVQRRFPTKGQPKSLVILAEFEDLHFSIPEPQLSFSTMLNQKGYSENGATGSARDYYIASSNGLFDPQYVTVGPYALPHSMSYYGGNGSDGKDRPARLMQFCRDAVAAASADIDLSEYDTDNDGYIDNVFIFYAGYSEAEGGAANSIWSHQYGVMPDSVVGTCTFNGKTLAGYACTSELKGYSGKTQNSIGTFCHEFGHVLGLPDYYHTADNQSSTLGRWDIMDNGSYLNNGHTPPTHSAFNRFFLGWLSPMQINEATTIDLHTLSQTNSPTALAQAFLLADGIHNMDAQNPNLSEYFILEYRQKTGWDTYLPDDGLIVWHIDYNAKAWADNTVNNIKDSVQTMTSHMRVYIENPSGNRTYSLPASFHLNDSFNPTLWSGITIDRSFEITETNADYCTLSFMGGGIDRSAPIAIDPEVITHNSMLATWHPVAAENDFDVTYLFTAYTLAGGDTTYLARREQIADTTFMLSNLRQQTIYTYYVSAHLESADTTVETFRSNIIKATTIAEKATRKMNISVIDNNGERTVYVNKPNASDVLYVYNEAAQQIYTISNSDNLVCFTSSQLPSGHIYIFSAGGKYAKVRM